MEMVLPFLCFIHPFLKVMYQELNCASHIFYEEMHEREYLNVVIADGEIMLPVLAQWARKHLPKFSVISGDVHICGIPHMNNVMLNATI